MADTTVPREADARLPGWREGYAAELGQHGVWTFAVPRVVLTAPDTLTLALNGLPDPGFLGSLAQLATLPDEDKPAAGFACLYRSLSENYALDFDQAAALLLRSGDPAPDFMAIFNAVCVVPFRRLCAVTTALACPCPSSN